MTRYWTIVKMKFCDMPPILERREFFYSDSNQPELDFRQRFDEEGYNLISVTLTEPKEVNLPASSMS